QAASTIAVGATQTRQANPQAWDQRRGQVIEMINNRTDAANMAPETKDRVADFITLLGAGHDSAYTAVSQLAPSMASQGLIPSSSAAHENRQQATVNPYLTLPNFDAKKAAAQV